jgi:hypothetical protein
MDISDEGLKQHWQATSPQMLSVFARMEADEGWAVDGTAELRARVMQLGEVIDQIDVKRCSVEQRNALNLVLGFLKSSRAFRLLAFLDVEVEGISESLLRDGQACIERDDADSSDQVAAKIHLERFIFLERFSYLARVFSRERVIHLGHIIKAIR